jgi:hypothetical protein
MSYDPTIHKRAPYYDDFNEDKKFLRMMFRPGYAVQGRELTQLQTILQNQIERVGDHLFENGSKIIGGEIAIQNATYIRFRKTDIDGNTIIPSEWMNYDIVQGTTTARVIDIAEPSGTDDDYYVFTVQYTRGSVTSGSFTSSNPNISKTITTSGVSSTTSDATVVYGESGVTKVVTINEGIFYTDGFFVKNDKQSISPYGLTGSSNTIRDFTNGTSTIGFQITKSTVNSDDDPTLRDPANGSYNYNAPGADRYKIELVLENNAGQSSIDAENFIELATFNAGKLVRKIQYTDYALIEDTLARRTYDESGSYVIRPFELDIKEHLKTSSTRGVYAGGNADLLAASLGAGKAYMFGYEFETQSPVFLNVDKARDSEHKKSRSLIDNSNFQFGNYFIGSLTGDSTFSQGNHQYGFPTLVTGSQGSFPTNAENGIGKPVKIRFYGLTGGTYANCGTALVYNYMPEYPEDVSSNWRFYITDYQSDNLGSGITLSIDDATIAIIAGSSDLQNFSSGSTAYHYYRHFADIVPNTSSETIRDRNTAPKLVFEVPEGSLAFDVDRLEYQKTQVLHLSGSSVTTFDDDTNQITVNLGNKGINGDLKFAAGSLTPGIGLTTLTSTIINSFYAFGFAENNNWNASEFTTTDTPTTSLPINIAGGNWSVLLSSDSRTLTLRGPNTVLKTNNDYYLHCTLEVNTGILRDDFLPSPEDTSQYTRRKIFRSTTNTFTAQEATLDPKNGNYYFELTQADVLNVTSIVNGDGTSIIDDFIFDNGQRDVYYDYGRLYIKSNHLSEYFTFTDAGAIDEVLYDSIVISFDYFEHEGEGPITVNSYTSSVSGFTFDNIPIYTSPSSGKSVQLANCIDFRGIRSAKTSVTSEQGPITKSVTPRNLPSVQNDILRVAYDYYVGRIDKIILTKKLSDENSTFEVLRGIPALNPQAPSDRDDSITLYQLTIPPYTFNVNDVRIKQIDNKRFTMKDIGRLEQRIDDIEYFTTLNDLEKDTLAKTLLVSNSDGVQVEGYKNSILIDSFRGHDIGDVANNDYRCSIDIENGICRPSFITNRFDLGVRGTLTSGLTVDDNSILRFDHTVVPLLNQPYSSITVNPNPFALTNWLGTVEMTPYADSWFDVEYRPIIKINSQGESDAWKAVNYTNPNTGKGYGSQWNDWQSIWHGLPFDSNVDPEFGIQQTLTLPRTTRTEAIIQTRYEENAQSVSRETKDVTDKKNTATFLIQNIPDRIKRIIGNRVIDVSIVPFIRSKSVSINVHGLKPDTSVNCFFDGIDVNEYCTLNGSTGPFTSGSTGELTGITFDIPAGIFESGEKVFRVTDDANNDVEFSLTSADGVYYAQGRKRTRDSGVSSIRPTVLKRQTSSSERIVKDMFTRNTVFDVSKNLQFIDPLTQTFFVDPNEYPSGLYLDSIDVYFASKADGLPITMQIRPTINSTAHSSIVVPFSEVTKYPEDINVNNDTNGPITATRFQFTTPVFLEPGEHAMCFFTNTDEYTLYAGELGGIDILTREYINKDPYSGSLLEPQNASVSTPIQNKDLMFKINRCSFSGNLTMQFQNVGLSADVYGDYAYIHSHEFKPVGTNITHRLSIANNVVVNADSNIKLPSRVSLQQNDVSTNITTTLQSSDGVVAPMIDLSQTGLLLVENHINDVYSGETEPTTNGSTNASFARYISRRVLLDDSGNADQLQVILAINKPNETDNVKVYAKIAEENEVIPFDDLEYVELENFIPENTGGISLSQYRSSTNNEYRDFFFRLPTSAQNIKSFSVKVVFLSAETIDVPTVKNLRAITLTTP